MKSHPLALPLGHTDETALPGVARKLSALDGTKFSSEKIQLRKVLP